MGLSYRAELAGPCVAIDLQDEPLNALVRGFVVEGYHGGHPDRDIPDGSLRNRERTHGGGTRRSSIGQYDRHGYRYHQE